jgi:hypothetical protein
MQGVFRGPLSKIENQTWQNRTLSREVDTGLTKQTAYGIRKIYQNINGVVTNTNRPGSIQVPACLQSQPLSYES